MNYISVCSGLGGAELAFEPLGWHSVASSEIEPAACSVLSQRYPDTPNLGDFTKIGAEDVGAIDLLVGGTPCQSFSVAGLRGGLGDDRGNLALEFLRLADRLRPLWLVWENVPGVYSATSHIAPDPCPPPNNLDGPDGPKDGEEIVVEDEYDTDEDHAFSCFLAGLSELGYGYAYRTLDAQYFGVPQRRRRVFVVGYFGDWRRAAAVLFEQNCLSRNPTPREKKRKESSERVRDGVAVCIGSHKAGGWGNDLDSSGAFIPEWPADVTQTLDSHYGDKQGLEDQHIRGGGTFFVPCGNSAPVKGRRPNDGQLCGDRGFL